MQLATKPPWCSRAAQTQRFPAVARGSVPTQSRRCPAETPPARARGHGGQARVLHRRAAPGAPHGCGCCRTTRRASPSPSSRTPPGTEAVTQEPHGTADGLQRGFLRHPQPPANSRQKSSKACLKRHGAGAQQQSPGAPNPSSARKEPEEAGQRATQPRNTAQGLSSAEQQPRGTRLLPHC